VSSPVDQQRSIQNLQKGNIDAPNQVSGGSVLSRQQIIERDARQAAEQKQRDQDIADARRAAEAAKTVVHHHRKKQAPTQAQKDAQNEAEDQAIFSAFRAAKAAGAQQGVDVTSATVTIKNNTVSVSHVKGIKKIQSADQAKVDAVVNDAIAPVPKNQYGIVGATKDGTLIKIQNGQRTEVNARQYPSLQGISPTEIGSVASYVRTYDKDGKLIDQEYYTDDSIRQIEKISKGKNQTVIGADYRNEFGTVKVLPKAYFSRPTKQNASMKSFSLIGGQTPKEVTEYFNKVTGTKTVDRSELAYVNETYNLKFGSQRIGDFLQDEIGKGNKGIFGDRVVYDKKSVDQFISDYTYNANRATGYGAADFGRAVPAQNIGLMRSSPYTFEETSSYGDISRYAIKFNVASVTSKVRAPVVADVPKETGGLFGGVIDYGKGAVNQLGNYGRDFINLFGNAESKAVVNVKFGKDYAPTPESDVLTAGSLGLNPSNAGANGGKLIRTPTGQYLFVYDTGVRKSDFEKIGQNILANKPYAAGALTVTAAAYLPNQVFRGAQILGKSLGLTGKLSTYDAAALHLSRLKGIDAANTSDRLRFGRAATDAKEWLPTIKNNFVLSKVGNVAGSFTLDASRQAGSLRSLNDLYARPSVTPDLGETISIESNIGKPASGFMRSTLGNDIFTVSSGNKLAKQIMPDFSETISAKSYAGAPSGGYIRPTVESDVLVKRLAKGGSFGGGFDGSGFGGSGRGGGVKSVGDTFKEVRSSNGLIYLIKDETKQAQAFKNSKIDLGIGTLTKRRKKVKGSVSAPLFENTTVQTGQGFADLVKVNKKKGFAGVIPNLSESINIDVSGRGRGGQDTILRRLQKTEQGQAWALSRILPLILAWARSQD